jgi:Domain of unknown function (DUF1707)
VSEQQEFGRLMTDGRADRPDMLASDADRDAVAVKLSLALAEGRLTVGEHSERVGVAYAARTLEELRALTADLPAPARKAADRDPAAILSGVDRCLLCALLILCPPAGIAWVLAVRSRSRAASGQPLTAAAVTPDGSRVGSGAIRSYDAHGAGLASPVAVAPRVGGADAEDR